MKWWETWLLYPAIYGFLIAAALAAGVTIVAGWINPNLDARGWR